jgi:SAM-dependent methyltransferase
MHYRFKSSRHNVTHPYRREIKTPRPGAFRSLLLSDLFFLPGECLPLDEDSIDTVVSTFTLCTIPGIEAAVREIARVLKPDGQLIFFELGRSPDPDVQVWQKRLEPVFRGLFQGLYLTRDIPALLSEAGFHIEQMESGYLAQFPKSLSYCWWGIAAPKARPPG